LFWSCRALGLLAADYVRKAIFGGRTSNTSRTIPAGRDTAVTVRVSEGGGVRRGKDGEVRLQAAGSDGYLQPVKFETRQLVEDESRAMLVRDGKETVLAPGEATLSGRVDAGTVDAPDGVRRVRASDLRWAI
jgi:hypothetical protein